MSAYSYRELELDAFAAGLRLEYVSKSDQPYVVDGVPFETLSGVDGYIKAVEEGRAEVQV